MAEIMAGVEIYFFFHAVVDGGYSELFAGLEGWVRCAGAPKFDVDADDGHGLEMVMYRYEGLVGTVSIPATTKDWGCFSMVFVPR